MDATEYGEESSLSQVERGNALIVALLYPFVLSGFAARDYKSLIDRTAASLGVLGVVLLSVIV